jgi:anaerobic magnesium-protoporphyrin IX monomethyl ester cyclase
MKILLVPVHMDEHFRTLPLGLAYIASCLLGNGHDVKVYDPPPYERFSVEKALRDFKADMIGISCMTPSFPNALKVAEKIKSLTPAPIVFGGIHPTAMPLETVSNDCVDYVVFGEGEMTMLELLDVVAGKKDAADVPGIAFKKGGKAFKNQPRGLIEDLDCLPFPARHLFPRWYFKRYMGIRGLWLKSTNMTASRGCPFSCTYCSSKVMFGQRVRFRSAKNIVDEIEHLITKYEIEAISFSDDTFTVNKGRVMDICAEIKRRHLRFKWRIQARADCIDDEMIVALKDAGCVQFDVGVESGSEKVLRTLKKDIVPDQVRKAFRLYRKHNVRTCATFMIGSPGETMEDIKKTIKLATDIGADYTQFFITTPYPGTPMYKELALTGGMIEGRPYESFHVGGFDPCSMIKDTLPQEELARIREELNEKFLRGSAKSILANKKFLLDTMFLIAQKPDIVVRALLDFLKSGKITQSYQRIYYSHNLRRY